MKKRRTEKFAESLRNFIKQIDNDIVSKKKIEDALPGICTRIDQTFLHDALLRCETSHERHMRWYRGASDQQEHKEQLQFKADQYHQVQENLKTKALPIYNEWYSHSKDITSKNVTQTDMYPFAPQKAESINEALLRVKKYIDHNPGQYKKKLAKSFLEFLLKYLLKEVNSMEVKKDYRRHLLSPHAPQEIIEWQDMVPLKINPGRYAISSIKAQKYIKYLIDKFLEDPIHYYSYGETLLFLWCLLAVAHHRRRICSVNEILQLKESSISYVESKRWNGEIIPIVYKVMINDQKVPISKSLFDMLICLVDQRESDKKVFRIDRSTIENHLREATLKLGYKRK